MTVCKSLSADYADERRYETPSVIPANAGMTEEEPE